MPRFRSCVSTISMRCLKYGSSAIQNPRREVARSLNCDLALRVIAHSVSDAALESSILARDSTALLLTFTAQAPGEIVTKHPFHRIFAEILHVRTVTDPAKLYP
jgi:hypothetical protein